jgi:hypothetical protein
MEKEPSNDSLKYPPWHMHLRAFLALGCVVSGSHPALGGVQQSVAESGMAATALGCSSAPAPRRKSAQAGRLVPYDENCRWVEGPVAVTGQALQDVIGRARYYPARRR